MIRRLLQRLLGWPCDHDWELIGEGKRSRNYESGLTRSTYWWTYRCKKCCESRTVEP